MLGAKLGYLQASVAHVDDRLFDTLHFVAQDDGVALVGWGGGAGLLTEHAAQMLQLGGVLHLLDAPHEEAHVVQGTHGVLGVLEVTPVDTVLAAERRLMNLSVGRAGGDAAEVDTLHAEGVATTEDTTHIVERPHIIEHDNERQLVGFLKLLHRQTVHLDGP